MHSFFAGARDNNLNAIKMFIILRVCPSKDGIAEASRQRYWVVCCWFGILKCSGLDQKGIKVLL